MGNSGLDVPDSRRRAPKTARHQPNDFMIQTPPLPCPEARLELLTSRVYVTCINYDEYEGPYIREGDCFSNTEKASEHLGCEWDEVGAQFCHQKLLDGVWGVAYVRGVHFILPSEMARLGNRPPMLDPVPGPQRFHKRTPEQKERVARFEMNCARRRMIEAQHEIILRDQAARPRKD